MTIHIAGRAPNRLYQRVPRTQEALLVRIQNRNQGHLRKVQPLSKEVDSDNDVDFPQAKIAKDLDAFQGVHLGMQVLSLQICLNQEVRQLFGRLLGQGGD